MPRTRRSVLSAGAALALSGCTSRESFDPTDAEWRVEEEPDLVTFVNVGSEPIAAPERFVFEAENAEYYSRSPGSSRPDPDELTRFRPTFRIDGVIQRDVPDRLPPGDGIVADGHVLDVHFTNEMTFQLRYADVDSQMEAIFGSPEDEVVLVERDLENQRDQPPDIDWETEQTETHVRFVHAGGPPIYGPTVGRNSFNQVVWETGDDQLVVPPATPDQGRWVHEGDAIEVKHDTYFDEEVRLVWKNRHNTEKAILAVHELEANES